MRNVFGKFVALGGGIIAALALMLSISATEMKGQTTCPPEPDCFQDVFQPGPPMIIPMNPAGGIPCDYEIEWCWRLACGVFLDIVITSFRFHIELCPMDEQALMDQAMVAIIGQHAGSLIPVTPRPCDDPNQVLWRLGGGSCLQLEEPDEFGFGSVVLCGTSQCWITGNVCLNPDDPRADPNTGLVYNRLNSFIFNDTCPANTIDATSSSHKWELILNSPPGTCIRYCD